MAPPARQFVVSYRQNTDAGFQDVLDATGWAESGLVFVDKRLQRSDASTDDPRDRDWTWTVQDGAGEYSRCIPVRLNFAVCRPWRHDAPQQPQVRIADDNDQYADGILIQDWLVGGVDASDMFANAEEIIKAINRILNDGLWNVDVYSASAEDSLDDPAARAVVCSYKSITADSMDGLVKHGLNRANATSEELDRLIRL